MNQPTDPFKATLDHVPDTTGRDRGHRLCREGGGIPCGASRSRARRGFSTIVTAPVSPRHTPIACTGLSAIDFSADPSYLPRISAGRRHEGSMAYGTSIILFTLSTPSGVMRGQVS
jgi:hypothetical protein